MDEELPLLPQVDRGKCCGYGICAEMCPSVFKLDDQGFAYTEGPVPEGLEAEAIEAGEACPEEAVAFTRGGSAA
jgi:ferredoxin